jgi:hypothetical protein
MLSQSKFNFVGIGFIYCDITNQPIKVESLLKSGPVGNVSTSEGFNHYEIYLDTKTFIHGCAVENTGVKEVSKITNMVKTKDYINFDVKTNEFGIMTCYINNCKNNQYQFAVQYKNGSKTEVAFFFDSTREMKITFRSLRFLVVNNTVLSNK